MQKSEVSDKDDFLLNIGGILKHYREKKGYSQFKLSVESGVPKTQIGRIERAEVNPTIFTLKRIADALEVSLANIFSSIH
jgi:transcriptional regulator with XRE-family HTH domain